MAGNAIFSSTMEPVVILQNEAVSRAVIKDKEYQAAVSFSIIGPDTLDAHTFIIETALDDDFTVNVCAVEIGDPPATLAPPLANKARVYFELVHLPRWRIKDTSGNVSEDREWTLLMNWG